MKIAMPLGIAVALTCMACAGLQPGAVQAQAYPTKPVRILIGYGAGGTTDTTARLIAPHLSEQLGRPFLVENRPGATGTIALDMVAKAAPDGYTTIMIAGADAVVPAVRSDLPYDLIRDFAPVALVVAAPFILVVHPSVQANDLMSLIAHARANPGKLNYSSAGIGSSGHMVGELLNLRAKTAITHIPYKGTAAGAVAVVAGEVEISFPTGSAALPLMSAGKMKALAVTSAQRSVTMPTLPTMIEAGLPGFERIGWYGLVAPAGTPREVVNRLNTLIGEIVNKPEIREQFFRQGLEGQRGTPEQYGELIRREIAQNVELAKVVKLLPN